MDLPEPETPTTATDFAAADLETYVGEYGQFGVAGANLLAEIGRLDDDGSSGLFSIAFRFAAACALALCGRAASAATILVYGDSLSAGYGLPSGKDWASLLADRLREEGLNYKVANASISGETTLGGKNRIAAALKQHQPDIVILALGANDGLRGGKPR